MTFELECASSAWRRKDALTGWERPRSTVVVDSGRGCDCVKDCKAGRAEGSDASSSWWLCPGPCDSGLSQNSE